MHINSTTIHFQRSGYRRYFVLLALSCLLFTGVKSQVVWENPSTDVYQYLYRMAQKGLITFDDNIRPLSRVYIAQCLDSLLQKNISLLTKTEKTELYFYRKEYSDQQAIQQVDNDSDQVHFFKNDAFGRPRFFSYHNKDLLLRADPVITAGTIQGTGQHIKLYSSGIHFYGYGGKHWGFYFSFNDRNEDGTGIDTLRSFTPATGIKPRIATNGRSQSYGELRGGISYSWKNGSVSFGQDQLTWGYSENGGIVLSTKAPNYPYIRLDYQPAKWIHFNYTHAWLNSDILDSSKTYPTGTGAYGGQREIFRSKFMATHSLRITPVKGLDIAVGESVVYSDKLEAGYLLPIMFFKVYDNLVNNNNINAGSNGQLFLQVSSRDHLHNTHLYGTLFIDEIRIGSIFDKTKSRNQLGYTLGASVTDIPVHYMTLGLEYTRINPFVYRNLLPTQDYTNSSYSLGDWMGNNADRMIAYLRYTPVPKMKCLVRYQYVRKGGAGTYNQQYFQQPQPSFLFDPQGNQSEWHFNVSYEWINRLYVNAYANILSVNNSVAGTKSEIKTLSIGLTYGL